MEGWEIALLAVTGLVAVRLLTNMMRSRHDRLVAEVQQQVETYREQKAAEERLRQKEEKKKKKLEAQQQQLRQQQQRTATPLPEAPQTDEQPQQQEAA